jgi:acyl-CoA synthetase (AMP-forming)/AMP-acid ligase II
MFFTVADCVASNALAFPDKVAIEVIGPQRPTGDPLETWTFGECWDRTIALADAVGKVEPGDSGPMLAILLPNGADHVLAYLTAQVLGAGAVPVNSRLAEGEVEFVMRDSGASVILSGGEFLALAESVAATVGARVVDVEAVTGALGARTWDGPSGDDSGSRVALVAYTSGTTGFPKGSIVTNEALVTRFAQWGWTFGLSPVEVLSVPGPVFHMSYGGLALAHLAAGGRSRIMTAFEPGLALEEYAHHSSWVFLVPSMTAMIAEAWEEAGRPSLTALRWVLSSGAPGPMALLDRAFDVFPNARITEGYGWTEGGWVTYEVKDRSDLVPHSVGWPLIGSDVRVVDADTEQAVPVGQPGEVVARTMVPFFGYLNNPEATAGALIDDGFVRSGDVGVLLDDGRLTIVDRVKDMIISGGENVYCAEVERVLAEHPGLLEATVVGLGDETWGERVVAAVVARPRTEVDSEEVITFCRARLAHYKCPKEVVVLEELPRNPMGKVQKFKLVELLSDQR